MKKIIVILTLTLLNSSSLNSMQSSSIAPSEQSNMELSVRITGTKDGIDVVIPGKCAQHSGILKTFLEDDTVPNANSRVAEKDFRLIIPPFHSFKSSDFERMKKHLEKIDSQVDIEELLDDCSFEKNITNIKQLLLADFFDIEQLRLAEITVLKEKHSDPDHFFLKDFLVNSQLRKLMKFIREDIKIFIREKLNLENSESEHSVSESESEHTNFGSGSEHNNSGSEQNIFDSELEQDNNSTQSNNSQIEWVDFEEEEEENNFWPNLEQKFSESDQDNSEDNFGSEHDNSDSETKHNNPETEGDNYDSIELLL